MKKIPILIAFFSISNIYGATEELPNCVSASVGGTLRFNNGAASIALTDLTAPQCYLTVANYYFTQELNHVRGEMLCPTRFFATGFSAEWFGYALYHRVHIRATIDRKLSPLFSIGTSLNLRQISYEGATDRRPRLSCDLFFRLNKERWELYGKGFNLFGCGNRDQANQWIAENQGATIGYLIRFTSTTSCAVSCVAECHWMYPKNFSGHFGMEYQFGEWAIRCGASGPPIIPSFGCGWRKRRFRIDVAARWVRNIGYVLDGGIGFTFKERKEKTE